MDRQDGQDRGRHCMANGGRILFGVIRSMIAELTASSKCGCITLPKVMMADIAKAQLTKLWKPRLARKTIDPILEGFFSFF